MNVLLDTNAFAWALQGAGRLTPSAQRAMTAAGAVYLIPAVENADACSTGHAARAAARVRACQRSTLLTVGNSPISIFEITQKVRIGKWPAMAGLAPSLAAYAYLQGVTMIPLDAAICGGAGSMTWGQQDPFDRMIAATALHLGCPLVSSDAAFDGIVARIW